MNAMADSHSTPAVTLAEGQRYLALGWKLCLLRPRSKIPFLHEWNDPLRVIGTDAVLQEALNRYPQSGLGLVHEHSGTGTLDIDHVEYCQIAFMQEFGINLAELFAGFPRIKGRDGHDKYLFRLPAGVVLETKKLVWPAIDADPESADPAIRNKKTTLLELRGKGGQDALPPTIHPDTLQTFVWLVPPWGGIPELPAPFVAMWQNWGDFHPQLLAACPWAKVAESAPPPAAKRQVNRDGESVISQFNARYSIQSLLADYGYKPKGKRWLCPSSTTGIPGVVVLPESGKCYSHHASDVLNDGHAHDAFDVFCLLEMAGSFPNALSEARLRLNIQHQELPAVDISALLASRFHEEPEEPYQYSDDYYTRIFDDPIPGVLGEFEGWAFQSALSATPSRHAARMAALGFGSIVLARRYKTQRDNYSSLLLLQIDDSGGGKEDLKTAIDKAMRLTNLHSSRMGGSWYTSEIGVISALHEKPAHITIVDEFGLKVANSRSKGNAHAASALSAVMEASTKAHSSISSTAAGTRGMTKPEASRMQMVVNNPGLTVAAMSTRTSMVAALTDEDITSGFLNRWLIMVNPTKPQAPDYSGFFDTKPDLPLPESIKAWVQQHCPMPQGCAPEAHDPAIDVQATVIPFTQLAKAQVIDYLNEIETLKTDLFSSAPEMTKRMNETAMRLALIVALSDGKNVIEAKHFGWARSFVTSHQLAAFRALASQLSGTEFGKLRNKLLDFIRTRNNGHAVTRRELGMSCRAWRDTPKHLRDSAIIVLIEDGLIQLNQVKTPSGQTTITYQAVRDEAPPG